MLEKILFSTGAEKIWKKGESGMKEMLSYYLQKRRQDYLELFFRY